MVTYKINLPLKRRIHISFAKRRSVDVEQSLFPDIKKIIATKKGNKFSRYFRHVFEHKNIKKILGANLIILAFTSIGIPTKITANTIVENTSVQPPIVLNTVYSNPKYPVENIKITQKYSFFHPGIDFDGITGDKINPIMDGVVETVEYSRFGYGNSILINHQNGYKSLYAHLSKIEVQKGQNIQTLTEIGKMGATGRASGDHLHFEVYENNKRINPLILLNREFN
jgi:murein DD-endopeptidase MepM/ murein hydrolase activator NlpD